MGKGPSLDEWAKTIRRPVRCFICNIPEREQLDERRKRDDALRAQTGNLHDGISLREMTRWLVEARGYSPEDVKFTKLRSHFDRKHHEETRDGNKTKGR